MLSRSAKLASIILQIFLLSACSNDQHSQSQNIPKSLIIDDQGQLIATNLDKLQPTDTDSLICGSLQDPAQLPYVSYGDSSGYNACVSRCLTFVVRQICPQLPAGRNIFYSKPEILNKLLTDCEANTNRFVNQSIECPHINCKR
jgi:hypothetical protein